MENLNKKFLLHCLNYGLILTGVFILLQIITYIFSLDPTSVGYSVMSFIVQIGAIIWIMAGACIKFRNKYLDKRISFLRCISGGLIIGLTATILYSVYYYVFIAYFDPEYYQAMTEQIKNKIYETPGIPEEMVEQAITRIEEMAPPLKQFIGSLKTTGILMVIMALLSSLFVRKKEKMPETQI